AASAGHNFNEDDYAGAFGYGGTWARDKYESHRHTYFYSDTYEIPNGVDVLWLRARVVCSSSIYNLADGLEFDPYVDLVQGEVEDLGARVFSTVPLPGSALLLCSGLLGGAGVLRRRKKN
ncbi:MAG: hypothetical protein MI747_23655, partial [Desulfobacterales bacterium]|nr:hypothetical protein [Desulfobacterales bacterium]